VSQIWHSAKIFFGKYFAECPRSGTRQRIFLKKISLPSALDLTLGKEFFLENTLPSAPDMALGKDFFFQNVFAECPCEGHSVKRNFFLKIQNPLCRVPYSWHSAKTPSPDTRQSFFWPPNFLCSPFKVPGTPS
jgi:hypothetical protein